MAGGRLVASPPAQLPNRHARGDLPRRCTGNRRTRILSCMARTRTGDGNPGSTSLKKLGKRYLFRASTTPALSSRKLFNQRVIATLGTIAVGGLVGFGTLEYRRAPTPSHGRSAPRSRLRE